MMLQADQSFVAYDNPPTLVDLSSLCIVKNIKHFVNEEAIQGREFYIWKEGVVFSDFTLEQIFQATLNHNGELPARFLTLFLGSRRRAHQFISTSINPVPLDITDGADSDSFIRRNSELESPCYRRVEHLPHGASVTRSYSASEIANYSPLSDRPVTTPFFFHPRLTLFRHSAHISSLDNSPARANDFNLNPLNQPNDGAGDALQQAVNYPSDENKINMEESDNDFQDPAQDMPLDDSERSSVTSAEDSVSVIDEPAHCSSSNLSTESGPNAKQQVETAIVSPSDSRDSMSDLHRPSSASKNRAAFTSAGARRKTIDSTGVLRRLVVRHNVSIPEPELLASLLESSQPLEITIEDCSNFDSKLELLELIAAHCPQLITLKLYRCGTLLTQCFDHLSNASPCISSHEMELLASNLDFSHLRVLALHALPAAATSSHASLLEHLADRLSAHLLHLDLSDANLSASTSFAWLSRMRHLRVLLLANCQLPKDRAPLISAICALPDLIRLDLEHLGGQHSDFEQENDLSIRVRCVAFDHFF